MSKGVRFNIRNILRKPLVALTQEDWDFILNFLQQYKGDGERQANRIFREICEQIVDGPVD